MCRLADDIQCSVIEEERRQKIFTFKKLESEKLDRFFSFITETDLSIIKIDSDHLIVEN